MNPFEILGIERDADATTIKRAYAKAVKAHRPDVDAEGFQRVTDAYHACLSWDQWDDDYLDQEEIQTEVEATVDAGLTAAVEPLGRSPDGKSWAYESVAESSELQPFLDELTSRALTGSPAGLEAWLRDLDAFYPLGAKAAAVDSVIDHLENLESPLAPDMLQVVLAFFAIDSLDAAQPWRNSRVTYLRRAALASRAFDTRVATLHQGDHTFFDRMMLRELIGPRNRWRTLFLALVPGMPSRVAKLHTEMAETGREIADSRLDHETAALWVRATDMHRLDRLRLAIVGARLLSAYLILLLFNAQRTSPLPLFAEMILLVLACLWAAKALFGLGVGAWKRRGWLAWMEPETLVTGLIGIAFLAIGAFAALARPAVLTIGTYITLSMISRFGTESFRPTALVHLLLSLLLGMCIGMALGSASLGRSIALGLAFGLLAMVALDEGYAYRHGLHVSIVRNGRGWLYAAAWVEAAMLIAAIAALVHVN